MEKQNNQRYLINTNFNRGKVDQQMSNKNDKKLRNNIQRKYEMKVIQH